MLSKFISMEFYKFKGTNTFRITIIGSLILPILVTLLYILFGKTSLFNFTILMDLVKETSISLFFLILATVMINYLFTVDIENRTMKSIIPLPVSKNQYLTGKFITFFLWMMLISIISFITSYILFIVAGVPGIHEFNTVSTLGSFIYATILLFLVMSPLVFVVNITKNTNATMVVAVLIIFLGMGNFNEYSAYIPWNIPSPLAYGHLTINSITAFAIIIATFLIGYFASLLYINKRDIPL